MTERNLSFCSRPWFRYIQKVPKTSAKEGFFAAQRRHRLAAALLSLAAILCVLLLCPPIMAALIFPAVIITAFIVDLVNILTPMPTLFPSTESTGLTPQSWEQRYPDLPWLFIFSIPALILFAILYFRVWHAVMRVAPKGIVTLLGLREPRLIEHKERRLHNLAEEMAIAADIQVPRIWVLDQPKISAATLGTSERDAALVVSRGLLERCSRDEIQSVIAHMIATIGNGDLVLVRSWTALLVTARLGMDLTFGLISAKKRRLLWMLLISPGKTDAAEVAKNVTDLIVTNPEGHEPNDDLYCVPLFLMFMPFAFAVGPLVHGLFGRRRFLADATAVQITRNPAGLAAALEHLAEDQPKQMRRMDPIDTIKFSLMGGDEAPKLSPLTDRLYLGLMPVADPRGDLPIAGMETDFLGVLPARPPVHKRYERLVAMGAQPTASGRLSFPMMTTLSKVLIVPQLVIVLPLYVFMLAASSFLSLCASIGVLIASGLWFLPYLAIQDLLRDLSNQLGPIL